MHELRGGPETEAGRQCEGYRAGRRRHDGRQVRAHMVVSQPAHPVYLCGKRSTLLSIFMSIGEYTLVM